MSGYFSRMLARARGGGPTVRAQATLPFGRIVPPEPPLEQDAPDATRLHDDPHRSGRAEAAPAGRDGVTERRPSVEIKDTARTVSRSSERRDDHLAAASRAASNRAHSSAEGDVARQRPAAPPVPAAIVAPVKTDASQSQSPAPSTLPVPVAERDARDDFRLLERAAGGMPPRTDAHVVHDGAGDRHGFDAWRPPQHAAPSSRVEREVHITIGRVDVTAVQPQVPAPPAPRSRRSAMSLEDYLARRNRGRS